MKVFWLWLYAAVPITALCVGIYCAGQQMYRQLANDPQIQLAEDGAARLNGGEMPAALVERGVPPIDIGSSLSPWIAVYDSAGTVLEASAVFDNAPPKLPAGVFDTTNASAQVDDPIWIKGEYKVTWQPRADVRQAVVVVQTKDKKYFVAAGRSLRLSEERTQLLGGSMIFGWFVTLVGLLVVLLGYGYVSGRTQKDTQGRG